LSASQVAEITGMSHQHPAGINSSLKMKDGTKKIIKKIKDSEGNEEHKYPVPGSNKTKINYTKEHNQAHKNNLKEEILQVIIKNFMEMLLDTVNQHVQEALMKFQDNNNKEYEKTQKQIDELIGHLNKYQSETENTISRDINELRLKTDNIKEVTHDMEKFRKKNETEI
jgi:hypothetical protein